MQHTFTTVTTESLAERKTKSLEQGPPSPGPPLGKKQQENTKNHGFLGRKKKKKKTPREQNTQQR